MATRAGDIPGPGGAGGVPGGGAGNPGAAPLGAPGGGGSGSGGGATPPSGGGQPAPRGLSEDILPPELRGRPEAEVKVVLSNLASAVKKSNQEKEALRKELESLKTSKPKEPDAPKGPQKSLAERMLDDPESTIEEIVARKFGDRFSRVEHEVGDAAFRFMRSEFDDFSENEEDIRQILKEQNLQPTQENVLGAYTIVIGSKTIEARRRAAQAEDNPDVPKGGSPPPPKEPEESALETEIRTAFGWDKERWAKYKNDELEVEVPT